MKYANVQLRLGKFYNFTKIPLAVEQVQIWNLHGRTVQH